MASIKDLAKAQECLANAETFLRQSNIPVVLKEADRVRTRANALGKLRSSLIGKGRK